jgi:hypothetical protein
MLLRAGNLSGLDALFTVYINLYVKASAVLLTHYPTSSNVSRAFVAGFVDQQLLLAKSS